MFYTLICVLRIKKINICLVGLVLKIIKQLLCSLFDAMMCVIYFALNYKSYITNNTPAIDKKPIVSQTRQHLKIQLHTIMPCYDTAYKNLHYTDQLDYNFFQ